MKQRIAMMCLAALLSGCNDNPGSEAQTPAAAQIQALEASGELPKLDRTETLAGIDADANGIRDDIDVYLAKQNFVGPEIAAANQVARAYQRMVTVNPTQTSEIDAVKLLASRAARCQAKIFEQESRHPSKQIEAFSTNTKARLQNFWAFNHALNGTMSPRLPKDTCE